MTDDETGRRTGCTAFRYPRHRFPSVLVYVDLFDQVPGPFLFGLKIDTASVSHPPTRQRQSLPRQIHTFSPSFAEVCSCQLLHDEELGQTST